MPCKSCKSTSLKELKQKIEALKEKNKNLEKTLENLKTRSR